jgi:hypothetical protein
MMNDASSNIVASTESAPPTVSVVSDLSELLSPVSS